VEIEMNNAVNDDKEHMELFISRVKRIVKMVKLNAPRILISGDIQQVYSMIPSILKEISEENHVDKNKIAFNVACQKNKLRICAKEECVNEIAHLEKNKIGIQLCYICQSKK
jgi:hypothetical protein